MYQYQRDVIKRSKIGDSTESETVTWGYILLGGTVISYLVIIYATIISKLFIPDTGNAFLDWVKHDKYYCYLLPAMIPVTFFFVYLNWMSLKFFRHN